MSVHFSETEGVSTIKLSDIADLPPDRHSFLYRHSKTPEREGEDGDKKGKRKGKEDKKGRRRKEEEEVSNNLTTSRSERL